MAAMPRTSGPEAQLYPLVQRWAQRTLGAWEVAVDTGPRIGRIDIVALRDFGGGDLASRTEVIAIEVKRPGQPFAKSAGQAHGYSVMADRCYLAQPATPGRPAYTDQEKVVASRLGIGLLAITTPSSAPAAAPATAPAATPGSPSTGRSGRGRVTEIATAPLGDPLDELRLKLVEKLGCGVCALCSTIFRLGTTPKSTNAMHRTTDTRGGLVRAAGKDQGLMWWLYETAAERDSGDRAETYWRRYLCPDCVRALAPKDY